MFYSALVLNQSKNEDGTYRVAQVENIQSVSDFLNHQGKDRISFTSEVGIFKVSGSINSQTLETQLALEVYGMNLGIFHGVPNRDFQINLDLNMVKGTIELKMNGFDQLYLGIDTQTFQVAENSEGKFLGYKKNHILLSMDGLRCAPWDPIDAHL